MGAEDTPINPVFPCFADLTPWTYNPPVVPAPTAESAPAPAPAPAAEG
mgnify:CR=1